MNNKLAIITNGEVIEKDINVLEDVYLKSMGLDIPIDGAFDISGYASNSNILSPWWSKNREKDLARYSIENDLLSSAINVIIAKLTNLPLTIRPKNSNIRTHQELAADYNEIIQSTWHKVSELFIMDMLTHDMGGFLLIEATNSPSQAMTENDMATGLRHIPINELMFVSDNDSESRPYLWLRKNKTNIRLHESKVIRLFQSPRMISEYHSVGLSFTSRAFNIASLLAYSIQFGLESLGQLDASKIIWATSTTGASLKASFKEARLEATNQGQVRTSGNVFVGMKDAAGRVGILDLKRLPDGFKLSEYTEVTLQLLAFSAGLDSIDLTGGKGDGGTTKSVALISELKSQYRLIAWFISNLTEEINQKFLPKFLKSDIGDASADLNESKNKALLTVGRFNAVLEKQGIYDKRTVRQNMVSIGAMDPEDFLYAELQDFRLTSGLSVQTLFLSNDTVYKRLLAVEGFDYCNCDYSLDLIEPVKKQIIEVERIAVNTVSSNIYRKCLESLAALKFLLHQIEHDNEIKTKLVEDDFHTPEEMNDDFGDNTKDEDTEFVNESESDKTTEPNTSEIPSTRKSRSVRSQVRGIVRKYWSGELTISEIKEQMEYFDISYQWRDIILEFIYSQQDNLKSSGVRLKDIYNDLHSEVLDGLLEEVE